MVERELISESQWIERWSLDRDADFSADFARSHGDYTIWLRSERLGVGTLPDVWLHAATGAAIDLKERQGIKRQLEILVQFLPTIVKFSQRADALSRLEEAKKYVVKLIFPRS